MISFKQWIKSQPIIAPKNEINFLDDVVSDKNFPESVQKIVMLNYLEKNASSDTIDIFDFYYHLYIKFICREDENC